MIYLDLMDLCEKRGFALVYEAACAASQGDSSVLAKMGIVGCNQDNAHELCAMIERAWFCDADTITARAIQTARKVTT